MRNDLVEYAVRMVKMCSHLPKNQVGKHIASQVLRSGTSPTAHYAEARSSESQKDFIHKLKICLKELNESRIWLSITMKSNTLNQARLEPLNQETLELCKIISASIQTSIRRKENNN